jgi:predicted acetyltransferase
VYTLPEFRGRGFATRLLEHVEEHEAQASAVISLLYSDIDPKFYRRLGYNRCPSYEGWIDVATAPDEVQPCYALVKFSASDGRAQLQALYDECHRNRTISIARDDDYWDFLLRKDSDDSFYWLRDAKGRVQGYVRLGWGDGACRIRDWALRDDSAAVLGSLLTGVVALARKKGAERVGRWLPDRPAVRSLCPLVARTREITMLKSLSPRLELDESLVCAAELFQEIDHV